MIFRKKNEDIEVFLELCLEGDKFVDKNAHSYQGVSFIMYEGEKLSDGHYISYIKKEGIWWCCSDSCVTAAGEEELFHSMKKGYFFCYERAQRSIY